MSWNDRLDEERLFLKRCHEGNHEEIQRFVTRSCMGTVSEAIRRKLANVYSKEETLKIITLCVAYIYAHWRDIPSRFTPLHERVSQVAIEFAASYRRKDLESSSP